MNTIAGHPVVAITAAGGESLTADPDEGPVGVSAFDSALGVAGMGQMAGSMLGGDAYQNLMKRPTGRLFDHALNTGFTVSTGKSFFNIGRNLLKRRDHSSAPHAPGSAPSNSQPVNPPTFANTDVASPKYSYLIGCPFSKVAADLRMMAASAPALTTEGATAVVDKKMTSATGAADAANFNEDKLAADGQIDNRGTFSTQIPAGRPMDPANAPSKRNFAPSTSAKADSALKAANMLYPAWKVIQSGLKAIAPVVPAATAIGAVGGAIVTGKMMHDQIRGEADRKKRLKEEDEFHAARMRMLDAATRRYQDGMPVPGFTLKSDGEVELDPLTVSSLRLPLPALNPLDILKLSNFSPRVPTPTPTPTPLPPPVAPSLRPETYEEHRPSFVSQAGAALNTLIGRPLASAVGPYSVSFAPSNSTTLRI
jgi:hypothetical protein